MPPSPVVELKISGQPCAERGGGVVRMEIHILVFDAAPEPLDEHVVDPAALSKDVHDATSIAAIGVATHEAGHAIQHAAHYAPLWLRSTLVPTANIGSSIGYVVMMIGLFMASQSLVGIGALLFSAVLLFQIMTLPVEFDATARAKKLVVAYGIISERERVGMDRVLNAAALTYVAAVVSTLMTLLYFLMRAGLLGGRDD